MSEIQMFLEKFIFYSRKNLIIISFYVNIATLIVTVNEQILLQSL